MHKGLRRPRIYSEKSSGNSHTAHLLAKLIAKKFALTVEPQNELAKKKLDRLEKIRDAEGFLISVPGSVAEELETNPFLRLQ